MTSTRTIRMTMLTVAVLFGLAACGSIGSGPSPDQDVRATRANPDGGIDNPNRETIWDIAGQRDDGTKIAVNRYLWNASMEVLDFLPIQEIDPFSGVFTTGLGTPPGGSRAYRATVYISDPALEARSLNVSLQTANGRAVDTSTQAAVENAILTRARQLLSEDRGL